MVKSGDVKTILISHLALPYTITGSWTNMYNALLKSQNHQFDYIICPEPDSKDKAVTYSYIKSTSAKDKLVSKIKRKEQGHLRFINALHKIIEPNCKYVIQIVDNSGLVNAIAKDLEKKFDRKNFFIQYCYHGFLPIQNTSKAKKLFSTVDEIIFLTAKSYKSFLEKYNEVTFSARIIHNGIDLNKFNSINAEEKLKLRQLHHIEKDVFVYMWCSHDRPKKGLHIAIDAFKQLQKQNKSNSKLLVIGINKEIEHPDIMSIGHIPNEDIVKYYQMVDVFLFPSLWQEGFGIVLAEALHCGCYIIASARGGIEEVLGEGKYGILIDKPNVVSEWVKAMENAMVDCSKNGNPFKEKLPKDLYNIKTWIKQLNAAIIEAKEKLI